MTTVKLTELSVMGHEFDVFVSDSGRFAVSDDDRNIHASGDTLDAVTDQIRRELTKRKVSVSVPFSLVDGRKGIARSRHAGRRTILVTYADGEKDELGLGYGRSDLVLRPDVPSEVVQQLADLTRLQRRAAQEERELMDEWKLDLRTAVDDAVDAELARKGGVTA